MDAPLGCLIGVLTGICLIRPTSIVVLRRSGHSVVMQTTLEIDSKHMSSDDRSQSFALQRRVRNFAWFSKGPPKDAFFRPFWDSPRQFVSSGESEKEKRTRRAASTIFPELGEKEIVTLGVWESSQDVLLVRLCVMDVSC